MLLALLNFFPKLCEFLKIALLFLKYVLRGKTKQNKNKASRASHATFFVGLISCYVNMSFPNGPIVISYHLGTKTERNLLHDRKFHSIELGALVTVAWFQRYTTRCWKQSLGLSVLTSKEATISSGTSFKVLSMHWDIVSNSRQWFP